MASLQEQLMKAGLANEKQAKQASKASKKKARDQRKGVDTGESAADRAARENSSRQSAPSSLMPSVMRSSKPKHSWLRLSKW